MKFLLCFFIAAGWYLLLAQPDKEGPSLQVGGKAYVRVLAQNVGDTVKIHSSYLSILTFQQLFTKDYEIFSDSSCVLAFDTGVPTQYNLTLDQEITIPIFIVTGDTLTIKVDYRQNKGAPNITFEGLYS